MTIDEIIKIINDYKLSEPERRLFQSKTQDYKTYDIEINKHLRYLIDIIIKHICEQDNNINWKPIIFTKPMFSFNAGSLSINDECKLFIFDSNVVNYAAIIAQLIGKYIPKYKTGIIPSIDDENVSQINVIIDTDNYNIFKNIILRINGVLCDPLSELYKINTDYLTLDKTTEQLRDSILLFLIGHEIAHVLLNHKSSKDKNTLWGVVKNWVDREAAADILGYELMKAAMSKIYPNIKYQAEFNLGFEIYLKCFALGELMSFVLRHNNKRKRKSFFGKTHPDAGGSRLDTLRKVVEINIPKDINEENDDTICESQMEIGSFHYIMDISNTVFDAYEKILVDEILGFAKLFNKQDVKKENYFNMLEEKIKKSTGNNNESCDFYNWKAGKLTKALVEFTNRDFGVNFYYVLSALHCYEYEKYYFRMFSCIGQSSFFAEGVFWIEEKIYIKAKELFKRVYKEEPDNYLVEFALGYTYSKIGDMYFFKKDYYNSLKYYDLSIEISPIIRRKTYKHRCIINKKLHNKDIAAKDKKIYDILQLVPNTREITKEFINHLN